MCEKSQGAAAFLHQCVHNEQVFISLQNSPNKLYYRINMKEMFQKIDLLIKKKMIENLFIYFMSFNSYLH